MLLDIARAFARWGRSMVASKLTSRFIPLLHISLDLTVRFEIEIAHDLASVVDKNRFDVHRDNGIIVAHEPAVYGVSTVRYLVASTGGGVGGY